MVILTQKQCSKCGERKPLSEFHQKGSGKLRSRCKSCINTAVLIQYKLNPEKYRERAKNYRDTHRELIKEQRKERDEIYRIKNKDRRKVYDRERDLKRNYGLTLESYNRMLLEQNGCCAICGRHQSELSRILFVDHNHATGVIRKLLCSGCNFVIGQMRENILLLKKIEDYLSITE